MALADVPIIEVEGISKSFGDHRVLDDLSFKVALGEKLALIGPSGSGKTTILRILMTLESISSGEIRVDGEYLYHVREHGHLVPANERHLQRMRAKIGMVFQLFNLFPHKTVLDNVALALRLTKGVARADAERRGMVLLEMVGMAEKAQAMPAQLSGGQKQRVAIARALALRPALIIADEATSALDVLVQRQIVDLLLALKAEFGMAMLFLSHNLAVTNIVCDEIAVMYKGEIVEAGSADSVINRPSAAYTQNLIRSVPSLMAPVRGSAPSA